MLEEIDRGKLLYKKQAAQQTYKLWDFEWMYEQEKRRNREWESKREDGRDREGELRAVESERMSEE